MNSEYQKLNFQIDIDDLFDEYLSTIKPNLEEAPSSAKAINHFNKELNYSKEWDIASEQDFDNLTIKNNNAIVRKSIDCLKGLSLTFPTNCNEDELKLNRAGSFSNGLRRKYLTDNWQPYKEFEHLKLFAILKQLPITDIRHVRVLVVPENSFLFIHNDQDQEKTLESSGYKCFAIQVRAVDRKLKIQHLDKIIEAQDDVFVFNDLALHAIPKGKEEYVIYRITCKFL